MYKIKIPDTLIVPNLTENLNLHRLLMEWAIRTSFTNKGQESFQTLNIWVMF